MITYSTSLSAPDLPPWLRVDIDHDFDKPLLALGIYLTAIKVMTDLVFVPWGVVAVGPNGYRQWATGPGVWRKGYDVEILIANSQNPPPSLMLTSNVLVTGLWETMVQICQYNFYYETTLKMWYHYEEIGTLMIQEHTVGATANRTKADGDTLVNLVAPKDVGLSLAQAAPLNLTEPPSYPSGRIRFPKDGRFSITYTYQTTPLQSKDIFMAVLGILATAAQYHPAMQPITELKQVSPSKRCAITLMPTRNWVQFNYADAVNGLNLLISTIMLPLEKFGEMDFSVWFLREKVGQGSVEALSLGPGVAAEEK